MAGQPKNRETGIPGGQVILDVKFLDRPNGSYVDDDRYTTTGQLPIVEIWGPGNVLLASSVSLDAMSPYRRSIGSYDYTYVVPLNAQISDQYKIIWKIRINGNDLEFSELFNIAEPGDAEFDDSEYRVGFAFGNPDLTSTHHASVNMSAAVGQPDIRGWGKLVSPDDLRYMVGWGSKLVSPDASQTYDDNMLHYFIDNSIALIERNLDLDILPRVVRHAEPYSQTITSGGTLTGESSPIRLQGARDRRIDVPPESEEPNRIWEAPYAYYRNHASNYMYVKLRRRPLIDCLKIVMADPLQNQIIDLYDWRQELTGFEAKIQMIPRISALGAYPTLSYTWMTPRYPFNNFPAAIYIDYRTGYLNAKDVPLELRQVILWTAGIMLMQDYSDGKLPGLATASASLNSVTESYGTTQSAGTSLLGARIAHYQKHIDDWYKMNAIKYRRNFIGIL